MRNSPPLTTNTSSSPEQIRHLQHVVQPPLQPQYYCRHSPLSASPAKRAAAHHSQPHTVHHALSSLKTGPLAYARRPSTHPQPMHAMPALSKLFRFKSAPRPSPPSDPSPEDLAASARRYARGQGVIKNYARARALYTSADDAGAYGLGGLCERRGDVRGAAALYEIAAEAGHAGAMARLGRILELSHEAGTEVAAVELYARAGRAGDLGAKFFLSRMVFDGRGVEKEGRRAVGLCREAADGGCMEAKGCLGRMLETGKGVRRDVEAAVEEYRFAARYGELRSVRNLGRMLEDGDGVEKDADAAMALYERTAAMYERGFAVGRDEGMAVELYTRAAEAGLVGSQFALGKMYEDGRGVESSSEFAADFYARAVEGGSAHAKIQLSGLYAEGRGVERDEGRAAEILKSAVSSLEAVVEARGKAVESGRLGMGEWESEVVAAARSLGDIYEKGAVGVGKDFGRAAKFYRVGTEMKCTESTRRLGYLYSRGAGVEENSLKARELYERAALSGNLEAVFDLGEACMRSNLVDDWLLAFDLLQAAGDRGHETARRGSQVMVRRLVRISREATKPQLPPVAVLQSGFSPTVLRRASEAVYAA